MNTGDLYLAATLDPNLSRIVILGAITWIMLVTISVMLAIGVSWSHIWRRLTGQFNVEDVDD